MMTLRLFLYGVCAFFGLLFVWAADSRVGRRIIGIAFGTTTGRT